ncbi:hypothetical protein [Sphingobium sp. UBA5915]|uniref:hypothetical protein n=1 Tax=Sphingobium sp. UBA5915 TaxID=1947530 RepID=UPI0025E09100|nr:hypothetical protein [Sphingobium sp. UBA5915]
MNNNQSSDKHHRRSHFDQWIDGLYQYDPLASGRDGFAVIDCEYGSDEHNRIVDYIRTHYCPGMVTMFRVEYRGYRKREWTSGPVRFEFEHRGVAALALLHSVGGAA